MRSSFKLFLIIILLFAGFSAKGRVYPVKYGIVTYDSLVLKQQATHVADSFLLAQPQVATTKIYYNIEQAHVAVDKTWDFYLLLFLCLLLGLIRMSDHKYFQNVWRAFWNPTLSSRQLREQLENASFPNLLMNIFFTISAGAYIYYAGMLLIPQRSGVIPPSLLLLMLIAGVMVIYIAKYAVIRFSGWAFRIQTVTAQYLFNVFLINKIIGMVLMPFVILFAFAGSGYSYPVLMVSFAVIGLLLINRYTRSWQVFGSFFQYSKFHFFTYLCASELLPLALLMKLLVQGLVYY
ncbi:MAG: DUF4271 domain-containing protein [Taibaiella sp.]|nr:DUF4271 domain-containing protein [Taibaiella sp.]